jgi:adenosylcobinamide-GDP ribazoletransferase
VSAIASAFRHLTILPLGRSAPVDLRELGAAAPWFPIVGAVLGLGLALVATVVGRVFPPLLAALLTVTAWKLLTGGLHLDGLADCLDALGGRTPQDRRMIMSDSRIGAFGAIGLILFLMLELAALAELPAGTRWRALIAAPAIARGSAVAIARMFRPARADGQGAAFHAGLGRASVPAALAIALVVALASLGPVGIVALAVAAASAVALATFFSRRLGGITGDVLGAGIEIAELTVLLTISAWAYARV